MAVTKEQRLAQYRITLRREEGKLNRQKQAVSGTEGIIAMLKEQIEKLEK